MKYLATLITLSLAVFLGIAVSCTTKDNGSSFIDERLTGLSGKFYTDPAGDTVGKMEDQHDILSVEVYYDTEAEAILFKVIFNEPVSPATWIDDLEHLYGYLEIDADQIQDSGSLSSIDNYITNYNLGDPLTDMWVDYTVVFHEYDERFHTLNIKSPDPVGEIVGYAPIIYEDNNCLFLIPLSVLTLYNGSFEFGLFIGTKPEVTDFTQGYMFIPDA